MRMVVVKNPNYGKSESHKVSCLQISLPLSHYLERFEVLTVVNKLANPYHIKRIQTYFHNKM